jgi:hypothetical protein
MVKLLHGIASVTTAVLGSAHGRAVPAAASVLHD